MDKGSRLSQLKLRRMDVYYSRCRPGMPAGAAVWVCPYSRPILQGEPRIQGILPFRINNQGRFTVPCLWDTKTETIVNNESSELLRIFNSGFNDLARLPKVDLAPAEYIAEIDAINEWVYTLINNGNFLYIIQSQVFTNLDLRPSRTPMRNIAARTSKNLTRHSLFQGLDRAEALLSDGRSFLIKDYATITEADIRLFTTIVRFDIVYREKPFTYTL